MSQVDLARRAVGEGAYVRFVVIKRIHTKNEGSERHVVMFQDEARIQSELHHSNIAQLYDFGEEQDSFYLAMEYVPGMDLRSVQRTLLHNHRQRLPLRMALTLIAETLEGLAYAHSAVDTFGRPMGVVHRDVNPRNVMLSVSGDVKLIDFGVAKAVDKIDTTRTNALKGKIAYMAPEQMDSQPIDGRADLFAVGLMLQEFINGASPFSGLNEIQIMKRVLDGNLGELHVRGHPDPDLLCTIRDRALATDPEDRYQKAEHFLRDIHRSLEPLGGVASREERAAFIHQLDPVLMKRIEKRLSDYQSGVMPASVLEDTTAEPILLEGSMSETLQELEESRDHSKVTNPSSMGWMALGAVLGGAVLVGLWMVLQGGAEEVELVLQPPLPEEIVVEDLAGEEAGAVPAAIDAQEMAEESALTGPPPQQENTVVSSPELQQPPAQISGEVAESTPEPPVIEEGLEEPVTAPQDIAVQEAAEESVAAVSPDQTSAEDLPQRILFISSSPSGLTVWVDGREVGRTPQRLKVAVGAHQVEVRDPSRGKNQTREVEVRLDGRNLENFSF